MCEARARPRPQQTTVNPEGPKGRNGGCAPGSGAKGAQPPIPRPQPKSAACDRGNTPRLNHSRHPRSAMCEARARPRPQQTTVNPEGPKGRNGGCAPGSGQPPTNSAKQTRWSMTKPEHQTATSMKRRGRRTAPVSTRRRPHPYRPINQSTNQENAAQESQRPENRGSRFS